MQHSRLVLAAFSISWRKDVQPPTQPDQSCHSSSQRHHARMVPLHHPEQYLGRPQGPGTPIHIRPMLH